VTLRTRVKTKKPSSKRNKQGRIVGNSLEARLETTGTEGQYKEEKTKRRKEGDREEMIKC